MISAFPKIFSLGTNYIQDIFKDEVEISEKLDGSQFSFAKINGELHFRSKGKIQYQTDPDKMFQPPINYLISIQDRIPDNMVFCGEILNKPKHNTLTYGTTPKNGIMLFAASDYTQTKFINSPDLLWVYANMMDIDGPNIFLKCKIRSIDQLNELLNWESYLGGTKIEGIVVKNYNRPFLLGGQPIPIMCGKLVSERFKEKHNKNWNKENTSRGRWQDFVEAYRTEARFNKAIFKLRDEGELEFAPRDIGKLIKEIRRDIEEEEKEAIKEFLWKEFGQDLLRKATQGFPEFYKNFLADRSFED